MNPYVIPGLKTTNIPAKYFDLKTKANKTQVLDTVCEVFEVDKGWLLSRSRKREVSEARKVISWIAVEKLGLTLKYTGREILNGRDHTTVIHSIRSFYDLYETEEIFKDKVDRIVLKLSEIK